MRPDGWKSLRQNTNLTLGQLDRGESEAIALAVEMHAEVLLIDDLAGRQEALRRGLRVAGTLSVVDDADTAGLVNFDEAIARLRKNSFRVSEAVVSEIMQKRSR
jgi:predicted nucleic acid-binding protein